MRAKPFLAIAISASAILAANTARAQNAATARSFLLVAYRHYQNGGKGIDFEGPNAAFYYHSSLLALIRSDIKANGPDNAPAIEFDPICACQDWKGIWSLKVDVQMETPKRANANVSFSLAPPKNPSKDATRQLVITLVPEHGARRIYDILDNSDASTTFALRKLLQDDIASISRDPEQRNSR